MKKKCRIVFAISDISQLPINYKGDLKFEKPVGQRPSEVALKNFSDTLLGCFEHEFQSALFDEDYLNALNTAYIDCDYFVPFNSSDELKEALSTGLRKKLELAAEGIKNAVLGENSLAIKKLICELIYFTYLKPEQMKNIDEHLFKDMLDAFLMELSKDPEGFLQKNRFMFVPDVSIVQKMFHLCLFNIKDEALRLHIANDSLHEQMVNFPQLLKLIGIGIEVPQNETLMSVFGKVSRISHPIEMLILGEAAVDAYENQIDIKGDEQEQKSVLEAKGLLKLLRNQLKHYAAGDLIDENVFRKLQTTWAYVMKNLG